MEQTFLLIAVMCLFVVALLTFLLIRTMRVPGAAPGHRPVVRLPVVTECGNCIHWDLEEGQAALKEHGAFMAAAQHITPAMMTREKKYDPKGNPLIPDPKAEFGKQLDDGSPLAHRPDVVEVESEFEYVSTVPAKMKWQHIGACMQHNEGRWRHDKCDQFVPTDRALIEAEVVGG